MLDGQVCIPGSCKEMKKFTDSDKFTLLASYPGSGNTWTRSIVEEGTRIWSGSVFIDRTLHYDGFKGELIDSFAKSTCPTSVIKTHYPALREGYLNPKTTGVILILRSPFDAILSEFSRRYGTGLSHKSEISPAVLAQDFPAFFERNIGKWKKFVTFWLPGDVMSKGMLSRERNVFSLEYEHFLLSPPTKRRPVPVLLLFYEDFIRNPVETGGRMFAFLKSGLGKKMGPTVEEAVICATTKGRQRQEKEKRAHVEDAYNVYLDPNTDIARQGLVERACRAWAPFWLEDVWGPCSLTVPQTKRFGLRAPVHRAQELDKFCNNGPNSRVERIAGEGIMSESKV